MNYINLIQSAVKGKAPIVAIPVEGRAPFCVRRKHIATWTKAMSVEKVIPYTAPDEFYMCEIPIHRVWTHGEGYREVEGPRDVECVTVHGTRWLKLEGSPVGARHIRSRCTIQVIDRRLAVKELGVWSAKEREKLTKKLLLGVLSPDAKKAMKRAKFEDEGDGMVEVLCAEKDSESKVARMGLPVEIPELPQLKFAIIRFAWEESGDVRNFTVIELITGKSAGSGPSAEAAILDCRTKLRKMNAEKIAEIYQSVGCANNFA